MMLDKLKKDIDRGLDLFLEDIKSDYQQSPVFQTLYKAMKDFAKRGGKRIRPALFLVSYLGYTRRKKQDYKKLVRCSLSLELLHDFLLIHDDLIDKSDLRRGKPTMHRMLNSKFGQTPDNDLGPSLSIVAGDILFALAINTLLSIDEKSDRKEAVLKKFTKIAANTGLGEFLDIVNNIKSIEKVNEKDVFLTYFLKTAQYTFEGPLVMGGILAGINPAEIDKLSKLGVLLGRAFQIQDDLLDIFSSSSKIGKPVHSDLSESKKTLLLWYTYRNVTPQKKKRLKILLKKTKKTQKDFLEIKKIIKDSGTGEYCLNKVKSLLEEAELICSGLKMKKDHKNTFLKLIEKFFNSSKYIKT